MALYRPQPRLGILVAGLAQMLVANSPFTCGCAEPVALEKGVRARLYWVGGEVDPERMLAPNQSPNIDTRIPEFELTGREGWFDDGQHKEHYVLVLEAIVAFEDDDEVEFKLVSAAPASLEIDQDEIAFSEESEPAFETFEPELGQHRFRITQWVNDERPAISLKWRIDDDEPFESIPEDLLATERFYFRPTNSAAKRMVDDDDRPGKHEKVAGLHPGLELMTIRPPGSNVPVGGLDVLPDGRLVVATFDARRLRAPTPQEEPDGELWLYDNVSAAERMEISRERIAGRLFEPCGVCVVGDSIYVSQRHEVTRFDYAEEEQAWRSATVASGWETNDFHALSFGLVHQKGSGQHPGYLFMARGTGLGLMRNPANHGAVWRIDLSKPVGSNVEPISGGHRTPNGIGFGPEGALFVTDNQGEWTPANELNHITPGSFYGFRHSTDGGGKLTPFQDRSPTHPSVWLPQDETANSPSEPVLIPDEWPFSGQMFVGDVKYGGINRVFLERVSGQWQGAAFRFTQGLEGGVNRLVFDRDGNLFVGCIGGDHASTWHWVNPRGKKTYQGLQRLRWNDRSVFDFDAIKVTKRGFRIEFTQPVPSTWLQDVSNYRVTQWRYEATPHYGGPKLEVHELHVLEAVPAERSDAVELLVEGRKTDHVVHFLVDPKSTTGASIWSAEAWYTIRALPN